MTKKLITIILALIFSMILTTVALADCSIWRSKEIVTLGKKGSIYGDQSPTAMIGYSTDHIQDLSFTIRLNGAEWDYSKTGSIKNGVTYRLENKSTMRVYVKVGTGESQHNFLNESISIPLYSTATAGGEISFTVDGEGSTVSSTTVTYANCIDGVLSATAKSAGINNIGELNTIYISDSSTQSFNRGSLMTLKLDNGFKFTNPIEPVGSGKFEGRCQFWIDGNDTSKAYVYIFDTTPTGSGKIALSGLVIERTLTSKFNVVLLNISTKASLIPFDTSFTVATFNSKAEYTPPETTEETTEATIEETIETTTETTNNSGIIVIGIGSSQYSVGDTLFDLDSPAFIFNNSTMLPLRALANAFGINNESIFFDPNTKTATLSPNANTTISITANADFLVINGLNVPIESPAVIKDGRIFLPLRVISNALGIDNSSINYDQLTKTVTIYK